MDRSTEMWRHVIVASLIGHCEAILNSGRLEESAEESLRLLVAETLSAFRMQPRQEQRA
jgi:hypothetical protein